MVRTSVAALRTYDPWKRAVDALAAGGALVALSPVIIGTALLVRFRLGPKVIFRQERPGRRGKTFHILKFRTMLEPDPSRGLVTNEERMTDFGSWLRSTSLDELPGLLNVLRGEMSLVGPRPLRTKYLDRYSFEQARRHEVRPGLTGLAQVAGRNSMSWDDRLELDVRYVESRSALLDLKILLATVPKVLRRDGIAEDGQATMSEFFGPRRIEGYRIDVNPVTHPCGPWPIVDRSTDAVVARGVLVGRAPGAREIVIEVVSGIEEEDLVRARADELMESQMRALQAAVESAYAVPAAVPEG